VDFKKAAKLGSCLSKDYAEDLFRLLITYESISASEAASRLGIHIKTTQDLLEDLQSLEILKREEVYEGKRPYFRYSLIVKEISFSVDLTRLNVVEKVADSRLRMKIREIKNAKARFTTSRSNDYISSVVIWMGEGRDRSERKFNLSYPQGKFLFHLPFPTAEPVTITELMTKAGVDKNNIPEIIDIVQELIELNVIESSQG
jgi:DNA-binding Lrp family transcriptional regulator